MPSSPPCCANGPCPTKGACNPVVFTTLWVDEPLPHATGFPDGNYQVAPASRRLKTRNTAKATYTVASDTCPAVTGAAATKAPKAPVDVELYWDTCCVGAGSGLALPSASETTSNIAVPTRAKAMSLHVNALPKDCLLNFYGAVDGWGTSPGVTYAPGRGKVGSCVRYPWYEVPDEWSEGNPKGYAYVARMVNVTCGEGVVEGYRKRAEARRVRLKGRGMRVEGGRES